MPGGAQRPIPMPLAADGSPVPGAKRSKWLLPSRQRVLDGRVDATVSSDARPPAATNVLENQFRAAQRPTRSEVRADGYDCCPPVAGSSAQTPAEHGWSMQSRWIWRARLPQAGLARLTVGRPAGDGFQKPGTITRLLHAPSAPPSASRQRSSRRGNRRQCSPV